MSSPAISTQRRLRNILLPTDFSSCSEAALLCATVLARRFDAALCTTTVVRADITDYIDSPDPYYFRHSAETKMASLACRELLKGIKHREVVMEGFVSETLSRLITESEIDLVVLGCHGRDGIKKVVRGSVSEVIVHSATCPVLTVGPLVKPKAELRFRKILFATDLLHSSTNALAYALWLAEQEDARLTLLHVVKAPGDAPLRNLEPEKESAMKHLAQLLPADATPGGTEFVVEIGAPADRILKVAEDQGADLIVMNPHHTAHARLSTHLLGVTPYQVLCHARCPVLTVRD